MVRPKLMPQPMSHLCPESLRRLLQADVRGPLFEGYSFRDLQYPGLRFACATAMTTMSSPMSR